MTDLAGKLDVYTCDAGHETVVRMRDHGVTPFMLACKSEGCAETAMSSMYRVRPSTKLQAATDPTFVRWQFVKPTAEELEAYLAASKESAPEAVRADDVWPSIVAETRQHVAIGGLVLIPVDLAESRSRAKDAACAERPHAWMRRKGYQWDTCARCGVVRRADGQNNPCRSAPRVKPRKESGNG